MKRIIFTKALLLVGLSLFSQFGFQVVDQVTHTPVEYAQVITDSGKIFYTSSSGEVSCDSSSSYVVKSLGYKQKQIFYQEIVDNHFVVKLEEDAVELDGVIIESNSLTSHRINEGIRQKVEISPQTTDAQLSGSVPDILRQSGQVYVQKSQLGGGSPVLRGFEASRVLLLVDGVRINNAIFRAGHLQSSTTIDPLMLESIDVLFGPGSLMYGSDAIGGTINFHTKTSDFSDTTKYSGNVLARVSSADFEKTLAFSLSQRKKKSTVDLVIRLSDFGDLKSGRSSNPFNDYKWLRESYVDRVDGKDTLLRNPNPYQQIGSGYSQLDFFLKYRRKMKNDQEQHLNLQVSTSTDVPRYGRLGNDGGAPQNSEWSYGPQKRVLFYAKQLYGKSRDMYDYLDLTFSLQRIQESRITRKYKSDLRNTRVEDLLITGLSSSAYKLFDKLGEIQYGGDVYWNQVYSNASSLNLVTNEQHDISTRYPSEGSRMVLGGVYFNHLLEKDNFQFHEGLRIDGVTSSFKLDSVFNNAGFNEVIQNNIALSAGAGINYLPSEWLSFILNAQTAFRAPNIDDLSKVFDSNPGEVVVPNNELKAERSFSVEGLSKIDLVDKVSLSVGGNWSRVYNLIAVGDFTINGQDSILYDGVLSKVRANRNAEFGNVFGLFYHVDWSMTKQFKFQSSLTFTKGKLDNGENMAHIPPMYGKTAFNYSFAKKKIGLSLVSRYNFKKGIEQYSDQSADRLNFATPEGTPAYLVFDLISNYKIKKWELNGGVRNLLDIHYRTFSSGINAPGRNFVIAAKFTF